ncbi:hypothetical protein [Clostridium sp.]|uniref:hypothetical protein n=1 Tax=Clostridium sp. TaxID=1506 RepID=UPI00261AD758|nr:hypothetical protein [Clostridium sp.]
MIFLALIILGIYVLINLILLYRTKRFKEGKKVKTLRIVSLISIIMFLLSLLILASSAMAFLKHESFLHKFVPLLYFLILIFISYKFICLYVVDDAIIFGYNTYFFKDISKIEIRKTKNKYHTTIYTKKTTLYFKLSYSNKKKLLEALHGKVLCINL